MARLEAEMMAEMMAAVDLFLIWVLIFYSCQVSQSGLALHIPQFLQPSFQVSHPFLPFHIAIALAINQKIDNHFVDLYLDFALRKQFLSFHFHKWFCM